MATSNARTAAPAASRTTAKPAAKPAPEAQDREAPVNRIADMVEQDQALVDSGAVKLTAAAQEAAGTADVGELLEKSKAILAKREKTRQIKLHARTPEEFVPAKRKDAIVLAGDDTPDMRIAKHREMYQADPGLRSDGKTPDRRFIDHRPDLLAYNLSKTNSKAGVVFADDEEE